jgi:hypothetical protein
MEDDRRQLLQVQRDALRMVLKAERESRWWNVVIAAVYVVAAAVFVAMHAWSSVFIMGALALLLFVVMPYTTRRARETGWGEGVIKAVMVASQLGAPPEFIAGMLMMHTMGMPSEKARMDELRLRLRELDEELG